MHNKKRIALSIDISCPLRHHIDVYNGAHAHLSESKWDSFHDPYFNPLKPSAPRVAGIVARANRRQVRRAHRANVPLVNVMHNTPAFGTVPSVIPDYREAGRLAAKHLISRGFRQFGILGYQRDRSQTDMNEGFLTALHEEGQQCRHKLHIPWGSDQHADSWHLFQQNVRRWTGTWDRPIGVFVNRDVLAMYLINFCKEEGINVPGDAGVVCTESCPYMCTSRTPTISSIDLAFTQVGEEAAQLLGRMLSTGRSPKKPVLVRPAGLVPRQSTDFFAVEDPLVAEALRWMRDRCAKGVSVADVAKSVHASRRTLERRFRDALGTTVSNELAKLRIEAAKRMLVDSEMLIKQIASAAGFGDTKRLNEVFRREEGCLPSEYRLRWRFSDAGSYHRSA